TASSSARPATRRGSTRPWPRTPDAPWSPPARVLCAGSADFYLAGLAALSGDTATADRHYRAAARMHRRLGARPMLAHTLHEHARLLDPSVASAALAEARAIAAECGMTRLLAALDQAEQSCKAGHLTLRH